jgi:hypothetical protein
MSARRINIETISRHEQLAALLMAFDKDVDTLRTFVNSLLAVFKSDTLLTSPGLAMGSTTQNLANVAFSYLIGGKPYHKAAVAAGTELGTDVVPEDTFGAVALDIDDAGTIAAVEAPDNATGYATATLAAAALPAVADDEVRLGYVTATSSDGDFTFGTTALNAADTTVVIVQGPDVFTSLPADLTVQAVQSPK